MLLTGSQLENIDVMSLQTGVKIASTANPIIDPSNLKIIAYEVEGQSLDVSPSFLIVSDVREFSRVGMIIDSSDELVGIEDVIKLKQLYDQQFTVIGKMVLDSSRKKIGKVIDYTVDIDNFVIQQLSVKRSLLRSLRDAELLIHRSKIVEINDREIIIKSSTAKQSVNTSGNKTKLQYKNPFRQETPQPETSSLQPRN